MRMHHRKIQPNEVAFRSLGYIMLFFFGMACVVPFYLIIISSFAASPGTALSDLFTGKTFRKYFESSNRTLRTTDLLFLAVSASVGFPGVILCIAAFSAVRLVRKQEKLLPYMGIVIAASAFLGIIIFPGNVF